MANTSVMMGSSEGHANLTGPACKADGWYGFEDGLHTVAIQVVNFTGRVYIEASMELEPTDDDWFPIKIGETTIYKEFPIDPQHPTGSMETGGDTLTFGVSFKINTIWLRARMDRTYLNVPNLEENPQLLAGYGNVTKITLAR